MRDPILDAPPPSAAVAWVERETGSVVDRITALVGGESSAVHRLGVVGVDGGRSAVVLRRFDLPWVLDEPDAPRNEARVLRHLATVDGPVRTLAPGLIASDPRGEEAGAPATLMTAVPGSPYRFAPPPASATGTGDVEGSRITALVDAVIAVHAAPAPRDAPDWKPWPPGYRGAPGWARHPEIWVRAARLFDEIVGDATPVGTPGFLHRDLHPGNLLWAGGRVSGIVDWTLAGRGPREVDVASCRIGLWRTAGAETAERFTDAWADRVGAGPWDPRWDLVEAVSMAGDGRGVPDPSLESLVVSTVRALDGAASGKVGGVGGRS